MYSEEATSSPPLFSLASPLVHRKETSPVTKGGGEKRGRGAPPIIVAFATEARPCATGGEIYRLVGQMDFKPSRLIAIKGKKISHKV